MANYDLVADPRPSRPRTGNDVMGLLAAEDRHIEASLYALSVSSPGQRRRRLARELNSLLTSHLQVEETTLHPLVRGLVGSSQEEESDVEHELIRGGLSQAMQLVDAPGFCAALDMLSAGVRRHVDDEEQAILPALIEQLPPQGASGCRR